MWKCPKCNTKFDKLEICWGTHAGIKVDIIDYFCPHCNCTTPKFIGTQKELDIYWEKEWNPDINFKNETLIKAQKKLIERK